MSDLLPYPIGTPGTPWSSQELTEWRARQSKKRSYANDVLSVIETLSSSWERVRYGRLATSDGETYDLLALRNTNWDDQRPIALITGGVHGYETSGVLGALRFAETEAQEFIDRLNVIVAPCVSPWAYERIQRWNADAVDPNRSFRANSPARESAALLDFLQPWRDRILMHIDLHETTDTDESEFRPALAARDGIPFVPGTIPDGFYLVDDSANLQPAFQAAILAAVAEVTHIAEADDDGRLIGSPALAPGVIAYPLKELGLCAGITNARFCTTTEVYPDSPRTSPAECVAAQVAAVRAAIKYALHSPQ